MRSFIIDGDKYTTLEYGKYMLEKTLSEGIGKLDPKEMSDEEVSQWGLDFILEQINEREDIEEIFQ
ncbi:hypothetical protein [Paenibacillus cremeus]|uniref:Uncharacterized protein n=1 Tax=Paenibacillus cremeus TaxID=2163881 RepID=A0A559KCU7_9BACL|nr:hypothetical protein [Paenibacillus cremeus]TVY09919.1 hypothetical protein FPZ49_11145 [Paenibacillus cremeus]